MLAVHDGHRLLTVRPFSSGLVTSGVEETRQQAHPQARHLCCLSSEPFGSPAGRSGKARLRRFRNVLGERPQVPVSAALLLSYPLA